MIYVISNGAHYTDLEIYFVDAPEGFRVWLESSLFPVLRAAEHGFKLLFVGRQVDWYQGEPMTIGQFVDELPMLPSSMGLEIPDFTSREGDRT